MDIKRDIRFRVYLSFTGMVILAVAIVIKAIAIQVGEGEHLRNMARKNQTKEETLAPDRGNIYCEDGTLLSSTIPQFDLRVDFKAINTDTFKQYSDTLAQGLSAIFKDASAADYKAQLKMAFRNGERYWLLKKNAPYYQYQAVRALPVFNKGKNRGGLIAEARSKRNNPYKMLGYRTIGLWRENAENVGLEKKYDSILSGKAGTRIVRKATGGSWIPVEGSEVEPVNGMDIVTTIDIDIQDIAEHALLEVLSKHNCQYGTAIVMEVQTGKIKALANLGRQQDGSYFEDFNYALIPTEPGSTFKLMSLYALLEDGYVSINDNVNAMGGVRVFGRQRVVDDHKGLGNISIKKAFAQSSNVAFASLVHDRYTKNPMKFIKHLQQLQLHKPTGIDLTGERTPLIKTTKSKSWNNVTSLPWIGYGYESLITPMHTCMVYNAVANNGKMMKPYLVSAIQEYGMPVQEIQPTVLVEQIGKQTTVKQMQEAMLAVVEEGTAKVVKSPYYQAAGKTGTAQVADKGITYADGVKQGSFVGYFPYDNPKYTIAVVVRSTPHGPYYGAVVGAPVFKAIADKLYANHVGGWKPTADSLKVNNTLVAKKAMGENLEVVLAKMGYSALAKNNWAGMVTLQTDEKGKYKVQKLGIGKNVVPDVAGMGLRDALQVLETAGLTVTISGNGRVTNQSLLPGVQLVKGQVIHLKLG